MKSWNRQSGFRLNSVCNWPTLLALEQPDNGKASMEDFERDMDLVAQGLDHLPAEYRGDYPREDIYSDHD